MSDSERKHIYKYDSERQRVIIIDSETGEEIKRNDDRISLLLRYMQGHNMEQELRKFAIWCARQPEMDWKPMVYKMFRTAEDYLHGDATEDELRALYEETEGVAISTDSVGLRQGDLKAPFFLAARACVNPDAYRAAREASRYHKLWAEMDYKHRNKDLSDEDAEEVNKNILEKIGDRQMDYLLELLADYLPTEEQIDSKNKKQS